MIDFGTLEANVCRHCQNRCVSCSHASPWAEPYYMEPAQLAKDLAVLKRFVKVNQFYCLGGEPLLHPKILELLDVGRNSGIARENCILTNGQWLDRMPEEFWTKVNVIRISVYPNLDRKIIALAEEKKKQYGFYLGLDYVDLFWKQFAVQPNGESFHDCPWRKTCLTVHEGHFYLCPQAAFFPDRFMQLPQNIDGLPLDDSLTEEKLSAYLNRTEPFKTCTICNSHKVRVPWKEARTLDEWMKESTL